MAEKNLKDLKILVTAGPTREYFDPVRLLSNPSSGRMGYTIAEEAARRGARVTLISGPVTSPSPLLSKEGGKREVRIIPVVSADDMFRAVMKQAPQADIILMAAAVSDYRPSHYAPQKLKKGKGALRITLVPNPDILKELGRRKRPGQILVGFAAETDHLEENARKKLRAKNLDLIIANRVGLSGSGFESKSNRAVLISAQGTVRRLPLMSKKKMAGLILDVLTGMN